MRKKTELTASDCAVRKLGHALDVIEELILDVESNTDMRTESYNELLGELSSVQEKLGGIQNRIDDGDFTDLFDPHPIEKKKAKSAKAGK